MARKTKHPLPDTQALLNEALAEAEADLKALQAQRSEALRAVATDPRSAAHKVSALDAKIDEAKGRINTLSDARDQAEADAREAARTANIAKTAADRATVMRMAQERIALAAEVDAAITQALEAIKRYRAHGDSITALAQRSLATLYAGDTTHCHDALALVLPRTSGTGIDAAVALTASVKRLADALGSPHLEQSLSFNHFAPKTPARFEEVARLDADTLAVRFGD